MTVLPNTRYALGRDDGRRINDPMWGECCRVDDPNLRTSAQIPWLRFIIGLFVAGQTMVLGLAINVTPPEEHAVRMALQGGMLAATVLVMVLLGWPLLAESARAIVQRRVTMEMLFVICLLGSFTLSIQSMVRGVGPVYFEVVAVLLIVYSVGRAISMASRRRALSAVDELTASLATARRVDPDAPSRDESVSVEGVAVGDLIRVLPGELIPVDGRIVDGQSLVRDTPYTGEWIAALRRCGDHVLAGATCEDGVLLVRATSSGTRRRVDELTDLIERARRCPTSLQRQADRFVRWFLPLVLLAALGTFGYWTAFAGVQDGLFRALAVLLVACPCAAGLATPLVLWTVLGKLGAKGLAVRDGDTIERLATIDSVIFDKTGTLGDERLLVESMETPLGRARRAETMALIVAVERQSTHPVAAALRELDAPDLVDSMVVRNLRTLPGRGVEAEVTWDEADGGLTRRCVRITREDRDPRDGCMCIRVDVDGAWACTAIIKERLRETAEQCVRQLQGLGLGVQIMTGDGLAGAATVTHLARTRSGMSPEAKHDAVTRLRREDSAFLRPLYIGDGLNDAAAMAASHASVALAGGSEIAIETANATLHGTDLTLLPRAVAISRRAVRVVRSNLHWAVAYNIAGIVAAVTGHLHPVMAVLLMACSSALVSWRSFRVSDAIERAPRLRPEAAVTRRVRPVTSPGLLRLFKTLHGVGLIGQGAMLALIAGLEVLPAMALLVVFALLTSGALRIWRRLPPWADMVFAMITLGGLGMNFGWWVDLGFVPATSADAPCPCHAGDGIALLTWMNAGMLLLGVPAMFLVRHSFERFSWRNWCCTGMLVIGVPGMVFGMMAGSVIARALGAGLAPVTLVIFDYIAMMVGMCAGMLIPHALEYALPAAWRTPQADVGLDANTDTGARGEVAGDKGS